MEMSMILRGSEGVLHKSTVSHLFLLKIPALTTIMLMALLMI